MKSKESLEQGSVQQLVQISEESFSPSPKPCAVPRLLIRSGKPSLFPLFRPVKSCFRLPPATPCLLLGAHLSPFHSYLSRFPPPYECRCVFRGGSGFRRTKEAPCGSLLCINQGKRTAKPQLRGKRGKTGLLLGLQGSAAVLSQRSFPTSRSDCAKGGN